eukprot:SAG11_NODE_9536_length_902_cov_1.611457_1_plen_225_part_10
MHVCRLYHRIHHAAIDANPPSSILVLCCHSKKYYGRKVLIWRGGYGNAYACTPLHGIARAPRPRRGAANAAATASDTSRPLQLSHLFASYADGEAHAPMTTELNKLGIGVLVGGGLAALALFVWRRRVRMLEPGSEASELPTHWCGCERLRVLEARPNFAQPLSKAPQMGAKRVLLVLNPASGSSAAQRRERAIALRDGLAVAAELGIAIERVDWQGGKVACCST